MIRSTSTAQEGAGTILSTVPDFTGLMSQGEFHWGIVSNSGVVIKDETSESDVLHLLEQAINAWERLGMTHLALSMKIADILNHVEDKWGEEHAQAVDLTRKALIQQAKTVENWQHVFRKVPPHLRHPALTYSHHEAVMKLDHTEQKEFLDAAEDEGQTVKQLRAAIKQRHPGKPRASKVKTVVAIDTDNPDAVTDALQIVANHLCNPVTTWNDNWTEYTAAIRSEHMRRMKGRHSNGD